MVKRFSGTAKGRITGIILLVLLLFASLAMISCKSALPGELTSSEKLWKDQKLTSYDFTLERQCFCPEDWRGPVNVQVRNGEVVSVTYVSNGQAVTEGKFDEVDTIDELFTLLKNGYQGKGDFDQKADSVQVTYHKQMGYPESLYIDVSYQMADEEQGYAVTDLVAR